MASTSISSSVDAAILDPPPRHDLEVLQLRLGVAAAVGLDEADDDVEAARAQRVGLLQHLVGLADARRGADVDAQPRPLRLLDAREQGVGGRAACRPSQSYRSQRRALVERQVQQQHVDDRLAEEAELAAFGVRVPPAGARPPRDSLRSRATRGT